MNQITLTKQNNFIFINDYYKYDTDKKYYKKGIIDRCMLITRCERVVVKKFVDDWLNNNLSTLTKSNGDNILNKIFLELKNISNDINDLKIRVSNIENKICESPKEEVKEVKEVKEVIPQTPKEEVKEVKMETLETPKKEVKEDSPIVKPKFYYKRKIKEANHPSPKKEVRPFNLSLETFQEKMKEIKSNMNILKEVIDEKIDEDDLENLLNEDELGYSTFYYKEEDKEEEEEKEEYEANVLLGVNKLPCYYKVNQNHTELYHKGKAIGFVEECRFNMENMQYEYPIKGGNECYVLRDGLLQHTEGRSIDIFFINKDPYIFNLLGEYHKDFYKFPCYCEYNIKPSRFIDYENFENDYKNSQGLFLSCDESLISYI